MIRNHTMTVYFNYQNFAPTIHYYSMIVGLDSYYKTYLFTPISTIYNTCTDLNMYICPSCQTLWWMFLWKFKFSNLGLSEFFIFASAVANCDNASNQSVTEPQAGVLRKWMFTMHDNNYDHLFIYLSISCWCVWTCICSGHTMKIKFYNQ